MHPILALAGLLLLQTAPASELSAASLGKRLDAMKGKGWLPLIDLSSTFHPSAMNPEPLAERLGELGVALMGVSCEEGLGWSSEPCGGSADAARLPAFILLPTGSLPHHRLLIDGQDPGPVFGEVSAELRRGAPVLGPMTFFMRPAGLSKHDRTPPSGPDAAMLSKVLASCAENKAVFQVVGPATGQFLQELERLLDENPRTRFVWGRDSWGDIPEGAGPHDADHARGLLDRHPNLYLDLSYRGKNRGAPGDAADPVLDERGRLRPGWKRLIEERPWRFLSALGLSSRTVARLTWAVSRQRDILSRLEPRVRPIVAYQTALRLLFGEEPPAPARAARPSMDARRRAVEALRAKGELPLIDLSSSFAAPGFHAEPLAERLEELGVALMGVSCPIWPASSELCAGLRAAQDSVRFILLPNGNLPHAALSQGKPLSGHPREWSFEKESGSARVLGPLPFFFRPFGMPGSKPAEPLPPEPGLLEKVVVFCAEEEGVLQLVADADDRFLPVLEDILVRQPRVRIIWSRACERVVAAPDAQREAEQARSLLERFPNLYLDLAFRGGNRESSAGSRDPLLATDGALHPAWKKLIEQNPDRVLSGLGLSPRAISRLPRMADRQRAILRQLPPEIRPAVAYKTAWRLLFGEDY